MDKQELIEKLETQMIKKDIGFYKEGVDHIVSVFLPLVEAADSYHKTHNAGYAVLCSGTCGEQMCRLCTALSNLKGE